MVKFSLKEGKSIFFILIFLLINIIILKVLVENSVTIIKRTEIIELEKYNENTDLFKVYC